MGSTTFQIVSDLHLETEQSYDQFRLRQTAPYLALLGDIGYVGNDELFVFLEKQIQRYWIVFFILGNHEPFHLSFPAARERMRVFADRMERLRAKSTVGRFVLLDQTRYDITPQLTVLGCTLFSRVTPEQATEVAERMSDFKYIQGWTVDDHNRAHASDLAWLNAQVSEISQTEPNRHIAIFTHYSPSTAKVAIEPAHWGSSLTSAFSTDLSREPCWTSTQVKLWAFGHTHYNCSFEDEENGKRIITNQRGYATAQKDGFDASRVFIVDG